MPPSRAAAGRAADASRSRRPADGRLERLDRQLGRGGDGWPAGSRARVVAGVARGFHRFRGGCAAPVPLVRSHPFPAHADLERRAGRRDRLPTPFTAGVRASTRHGPVPAWGRQRFHQGCPAPSRSSVRFDPDHRRAECDARRSMAFGDDRLQAHPAHAIADCEAAVGPELPYLKYAAQPSGPRASLHRPCGGHPLAVDRSRQLAQTGPARADMPVQESDQEGALSRRRRAVDAPTCGSRGRGLRSTFG